MNRPSSIPLVLVLVLIAADAPDAGKPTSPGAVAAIEKCEKAIADARAAEKAAEAKARQVEVDELKGALKIAMGAANLAEANRIDGCLKRLQGPATAPTTKPAGAAVLTYAFTARESLDDFEIVGNAAIRPDGGVELSNGTPSAIRTKAIFKAPIRVEFEAYCMPGGVLDVDPSILGDAPAAHGGLSVAMGDSFNRATHVDAFGARIDLKHVPMKPKETHKIALSVDEAGNAEAQIDGRLVYKGAAPTDLSLAGHIIASGGRGDVVYTKITIHGKKVGDN
jgi:hypothetical protein